MMKLTVPTTRTRRPLALSGGMEREEERDRGQHKNPIKASLFAQVFDNATEGRLTVITMQ